MKLSDQELITLKFALSMANEELSNIIATGDPEFWKDLGVGNIDREQTSEKDFLSEVELLQKRVDKTINRKLAIYKAKIKHGENYAVTLDPETHKYTGSELSDDWVDNFAKDYENG